MRQPRVYIDVQHGLCNRLRAWASAAAIADATDRELVLIWCADNHCEAQAQDLFIPEQPVISSREQADLCRASSERVFNYMEIESGADKDAPIKAGSVKGDIYIRSAYTLISPDIDRAFEHMFLRRLVPVPQVCELLAELSDPVDIAMHVRMGTGKGFDHISYEAPHNWPEERHRELSEWRAKSHWQRFADRLRIFLANNPDASVFLAADLAEVYAAFDTAFPGRIRTLYRPDFDRSARQLQYALADLMVLARARFFLASTWSSFSDVAQRLARGKRPFERSGMDF